MNEFTNFIQLVKAMRDAQNNYFRNRTQTDLTRAKNLERQVDVQIEKHIKGKQAEQLNLMPTGEKS